ncbi:SLAP domain-containing protein [Ornithinibacillus halotolerans]|uniref:SLAP domain-containing protein n=1 Tax=Ornithinibacillus halotolerans TaxID=1274357 RepID=A0A916RWX2_9BACI|nr:SLAP domain-containing protein [Ornithinibacillus halotolerans]GGA74719.1 hypothetical protein GCM10008025_18090 [Ornithinibacillus halotolerans]
MHTLNYQTAWEKQISAKDKALVERKFEETILEEDTVQYTLIRKDRNYKNELLVLVLVHNTTDQDIMYKQKKLCLWHNDTLVAEHIFTLHNLTVKSNSSMPWTFIFPIGTYNLEEKIEIDHIFLRESIERKSEI